MADLRSGKFPQVLLQRRQAALQVGGLVTLLGHRFGFGPRNEFLVVQLAMGGVQFFGQAPALAFKARALFLRVHHASQVNFHVLEDGGGCVRCALHLVGNLQALQAGQ